jgi:hypothetical protein
MAVPVEFEDVAPVVPVRDLQAALDRYRRLGFNVRAYGHGTGYGYADRGRVSIHLSEWDEHDPARTGAVIYVYVSKCRCRPGGVAGFRSRGSSGRGPGHGVRNEGVCLRRSGWNVAPSWVTAAIGRLRTKRCSVR